MGALALLMLSACGSPTAPSVAAVGGVWTYNVVVASITGGECLESPIQSAVGNRDHGTLSITQTGGNIVEAIFPALIDPVQPMRDLRSLAHVLPGQRSAGRCNGHGG